MASLQRTSDGKHWCGGTLVASKYIVSAAHCFFIRNSLEPLPEDYCVVRLGDHNLNETGETEIPEKTIKIKKVFTHEEYEIFKRENSTYTLYNKNDIALLELTEEVDLNVYTVWPSQLMAHMRGQMPPFMDGETNLPL